MTDPAADPSPRPWPALALLGAGIVLWLTLGGHRFGGTTGAIALGIALVLGLLLSFSHPARTFADATLTRLRNPTPRTRAITATVLALVAATYLLLTAIQQERVLAPVLHDEHCYIIQTRMLAHGHLWMPRHELHDFFDSFHLITDRVYAAKYGPGAALFGVPAVWLDVDLWTVPLILTAASITLIYLILAQTIDGLAALLGALWLPSLSLIRRIALEFHSEAPILFLTLLAVWAVLHWRRSHATRWLVLLGIAVGWAAITRPADAACLALATGLAVLTSLRPLSPRRRLTALGTLAVAALPFLVLQLIADKGIAGDWTRLPWSYYAQHNSPYDTLDTIPIDPERQTASVVPAIRKFERTFVIPAYRARRTTPYPRRVLDQVLRPTLAATIPNPLLLTLLPVGLLSLTARSRWILPMLLLPFILLYALYSFFLDQYAAAALPAIVLLILLGGHSLACSLRTAAARLAIPLLLLAAILTAYPQLQPHPPSEGWDFAPILRLIDARLADLERRPAVVLFRFDEAAGNPHIEPVYNTDVAWPDDAPVIRAHDLGPTRNHQLFDYYARLSRDHGAPDRAVYLVDLAALRDPPQYLGTVGDLAAKAP